MDIRADAESLRVLFQNPRRFFVPRYQRPIAWKEEDYKELWEDLLNAYETAPSDDYFLGAVVLTENARSQDHHEVVDGQQRFAAFTIILNCLFQYADKAMRSPDEWLTNSDEETSKYAEAIRDEVKPLLIISNLRKEFRLTLTRRDQEHLRDDIYEGNYTFNDADLKIKSGESNLRKGKKVVLRELKRLIERERGDLSQLHSFVAFLLDRTKFVRIFVGDSSDAFSLFESLNWKGEKLSHIDLLKNKVLSKNRDSAHMDELADRWEEVCEEIIRDSGKQVIDFIRDHENSRSGKGLSANNLYKELGKEIDKPNFRIDSYLRNLSQASSAYIEITSGSNSWPNASLTAGSTEEVLAEINHLNYDACMPFLLRTKMDHPESLNEAARISIAILFRGKTVGSMTGQEMVGIFNSLVKEIEKTKSFDEIYAPLSKFIQDHWDLRDNGFRDNFEKFESKTKGKATKYALTKIYASRFGSALTVSYGNVDLEHIFPQKPGSSWLDFDKKGLDKEDWIYRIGNTILLERKLNRGDASNSNFQTKKKAYLQSKLQDGPEIASRYTSWTAETILDRSCELAERAVSVWPLPTK